MKVDLPEIHTFRLNDANLFEPMRFPFAAKNTLPRTTSLRYCMLFKNFACTTLVPAPESTRTSAGSLYFRDNLLFAKTSKAGVQLLSETVQMKPTEGSFWLSQSCWSSSICRRMRSAADSKSSSDPSATCLIWFLCKYGQFARRWRGLVG